LKNLLLDIEEFTAQSSFRLPACSAGFIQVARKIRERRTLLWRGAYPEGLEKNLCNFILSYVALL
jgi:hypothetical protein